MKKLAFLLLLISISIKIDAQSLSIHFENSYNFSALKNAYAVLSQPGIPDRLFTTGKNGNIFIPSIVGKVKLYCYAKDYQSLVADLEINNDLKVKVILKPEQYRFPTLPNNVLLDGLILDETTGKPITGAQVQFIEHNISLVTNMQGKFQLTKEDLYNYALLKEGVDSLHYRVQKQGYKTYEGVYRFNRAAEITGINLLPEHRSFKISEPVDNTFLIDLIKNSVSYFERSVTTGCSGLPTTIRVGINCSCNSCTSVAVMSLQSYVEKGLNDEWIGSWQMESLKAGSLAYKSYGAYYVLHPINPNYDLSNTTCKQVWDNDVSPNCVSAAQATQGIFLVNPSDNIARAEYSAENNGLNAPSGESCGDGYSGTGSSWPCISDNVCAGHDRYGHGRGMCQWGTQRWAQQFKSYEWITDHYYNPGNFYRCDVSHPQPDLTAYDPAIDVSVVTPGHTVNVTARVQNISTGYSDRTKMAFYLSTDATFDTGDTLLSYIYINSLDSFESQNISKSLTIPVTTADGTYHIILFEDYQNYVGETNENNNIQTLPITVDSSNAISQNFITQNIELFPNPTQGLIHIRKKENIDIQRICLYNLQGQFLSEYPAQVKNIDISNLPTGVYTISITDSKQQLGVFRITKK